MDEHVICVRWQDNGECSRDCFFCDVDEGCNGGWDKARLPTEKCPGPGRYKLVRIDSDERDGILGQK